MISENISDYSFSLSLSLSLSTLTYANSEMFLHQYQFLYIHNHFTNFVSFSLHQYTHLSVQSPLQVKDIKQLTNSGIILCRVVPCHDISYHIYI